MESLFHSVIGLSLAVSPLLLLLLLCGPILARRYAPKLQYFICLVLAARLLILWNPIPELRKIHLPLPTRQTLSDDSDNPIWPFLADEHREDEQVVPDLPKPAIALETHNSVNMLALIWLCGAMGFILYHLCSYAYLRRKLLRSQTPIADRMLVDQFEQVKKELGIQNGVRLCFSDEAVTPVLIGFIRPCVVLPSYTFPSEQSGLVLRHELIHYKRRDLWFKLLLLCVRTVHWFNPLAHLMAFEASRTVEHCCDAEVLRRADEEQRREYGFAILSTLEHGTAYTTALHNGFSGSKRQIKKRFIAIVESVPARAGRGIVSLVLISSLLLGSLVSFAQPADTSLAEHPGDIVAGSVAEITPDLTGKVLELREQNEYVTGWLQVPGTTINDPILFREDNIKNEYFLRTDIDGNPNQAGSYFADFRSVFGAGDRDALGRNTVLYGNSRNRDPDDVLFGQLNKYRDPEFAKSHPYIFFSTDTETIAWEVFAVFDAHVNLPYVLSDPKSISVEDLLTAIEKSSIYQSGLDVTPEDKVLTLSTNSHMPERSMFDYRFAVVAKMVSPDEAHRELALLTDNPSPVSPDAYQHLGG
jgi:SrtB family sortase